MDTTTQKHINVVPDTATVNQVNMVVNVDKGEKIKLLKLIL
jgi:outer membrane protein insertion porin family